MSEKSFVFPPAELKIARRNNIFKVFDILRKKYVSLTDEEFVRQSFVAWMINSLGYPSSLMANEIGIHLNDTFKRCDTVVYDNHCHPAMIIEYKSPEIKINQNVFDQILNYNIVLCADFLIITNGWQLFCCRRQRDNNSYIFLKQMPSYSQVLAFLNEA